MVENMIESRILVRTSMCWSHFTSKGDVESKVALFVPPKAPHDLYGSYYNVNKSNLKLYAIRVFISDGFDDLLPAGWFGSWYRSCFLFLSMGMLKGTNHTSYSSQMFI